MSPLKDDVASAFAAVEFAVVSLSEAAVVADAPSLHSELSPHGRTPRTFATHYPFVCIHHVLF